MPRRLGGRLLFGCGPCRPKWVKLVDNIYTDNQSEGIDKLVCHCARKPDKLDSIAKYLHKRLLSDLHHRNYANVNITMEAISALVNTCYRLKLNLFDSSFLKMVLLLLEQDLPELQLLGTKSFLGFSQIEEDAPSYHREYDDLVDHFARMAYSKLPNEIERKKVRVAGIKGLQGVVRKTAKGQLRINALQSMEKIVPALLFNIHERPPQSNETDESEPGCQAVFVFKDVACRASFTNIIPVVSTMISHFDHHKLWTPSDFPLLVFGYLLDSIKNMQVAHNLVKELINYLRRNDTRLTTLQRISVVMVIDKTIITLAKGAIGPDVFHNFKALLQILRSSIEKTSKGVGADEQRFHDAIMHTIAEFAKNLPDAQKIELLKFILNFDPLPSGRSDSKDYSKPMVKVLVKTMLTMAIQYQTVAISNAIDFDFLRLLLHGVALDPDASIRVYVQKILHALIDRHNNAPKLLAVRIYPPEEVKSVYTLEKPSRQDILFMKKTGFVLTENIFHQMLDPSNKVDNLEHLMCTIGLIALEMGAEEVLSELLRLVLAVQQKTLESTDHLPLPHLCAIHAVLATVMSIIVPISRLNESLLSHVQSVIQTRKEKAPYLLPEVAFNRKNTQETYPAQLVIPEDMLFILATVKSAMIQVGFDASTLDIPYPAFDPLKALQSLRVVMMGTRMNEYNTSVAGGAVSGPSDYGSMTRCNGWGAYSGTLGKGGRPGDPFGNVGLYGSRSAVPMAPDSQSISSLSMVDSTVSMPNTGSQASDLDRDEFISFKYAQKILAESPEARRKRKTAENRASPKYDRSSGKPPMDFNELCALHKKRAQTQRFNVAGVVSDLSSELNRQKPQPRRVSINERGGGGLSFLRGGGGRSEKPDASEAAARRAAGGGGAEENSGGEGEVASGAGGAEEETAQTSTGEAASQSVPPPTQSTWDSNYISLFVS
uniref:Protein EFR3 homolog A n=2 Tax=Mesocestoides corti TaxID=53468 RepID=A0A5K3EGJ2_MESCO